MYYFYVLFILLQVPQKQDTSKDIIHKISANVSKIKLQLSCAIQAIISKTWIRNQSNWSF